MRPDWGGTDDGSLATPQTLAGNGLAMSWHKRDHLKGASLGGRGVPSSSLAVLWRELDLWWEIKL